MRLHVFGFALISLVVTVADAKIYDKNIQVVKHLEYGACTGIQKVSENIHRRGEPFQNQTVTYSWDEFDTYRVTCFIAINKDPASGSTVSLRDGGPDRDFVSLDFTSAKGGGLDFDLQIWAKERPH